MPRQNDTAGCLGLLGFVAMVAAPFVAPSIGMSASDGLFISGIIFVVLFVAYLL